MVKKGAGAATSALRGRSVYVLCVYAACAPRRTVHGEARAAQRTLIRTAGSGSVKRATRRTVKGLDQFPRSAGMASRARL